MVMCQGLFPFGSFKTRPSYKCVERSKVSAWGEQNQFLPPFLSCFCPWLCTWSSAASLMGIGSVSLALLMLVDFFSLNVAIKL
jgi:hypothetical protein